MSTHSSTPAAPADPGPPGDRPFCVAVGRGDLVESRHRVDACVADANGRIVESWGDVARPTFPRSAIKALQALPLVETGAADAFGLGDRELALACASHGGEPVHVDAVLAWLARLGLDDAALACGAHLPRHEGVLTDLIRSGRPLWQAHNNCSGKHAGMLSHAVHRGEPPAGYLDAGHPAQARALAAVAEMCGARPGAQPLGIDGCGVPNPALPLAALAAGFARLATPDALPPERAAACRRLTRAMLAEPYMVAGRDRLCTALMQAARGRVVAKTGAEGVFLAALPGTGLGLALKVRDGAGRAAELACLALVDRLGGLDAAARARLADRLAPPVRNVRGLTVGTLRVTPAEAVPF